MVKRWFAAKTPLPAAEVQSQQDRLMQLSGEVLQRYRKELDREIMDPVRLQAVYGAAFTSADTRRQAEVVAQMASSMLNTPHAMVNVLTDQRQETVAAIHDGQIVYGESTPIGQSYCQHVIGTGRELAIDESQKHPLVCDTHLARNGEVTSYLGVPIANHDGIIVGVLCVYDSAFRDWSSTDVGMLTQLSMVLTRTLP